MIFKKPKVILLLGILALIFYGCSSQLSIFENEIYVKEVVKSELVNRVEIWGLFLKEKIDDFSIAILGARKPSDCKKNRIEPCLGKIMVIM
jgi:hypothetical protein